MRLVMGVIVVAMGIVVTAHTSMGFVQIVGGALLVWAGVKDEIKKHGQAECPGCLSGLPGPEYHSSHCRIYKNSQRAH